MDTSHSRRQGYIFLLVLSYSSVLGLASNMNISSNDARGNKTDSFFEDQYTYTHYGTDMGKEYIVCAESTMEYPWVLGCNKSKEVFTKINFADYGDPSGKCEHYRHGNCGAETAFKVAKKVSKINDMFCGLVNNKYLNEY